MHRITLLGVAILGLAIHTSAHAYNFPEKRVQLIDGCTNEPIKARTYVHYIYKYNCLGDKGPTICYDGPAVELPEAPDAGTYIIPARKVFKSHPLGWGPFLMIQNPFSVYGPDVHIPLREYKQMREPSRIIFKRSCSENSEAP